jgi:peptide/nickel transport system substrate-binding protein
VDVIDNVPTDRIEKLRKRSDVTVVSRPGLRVLFLVLPPNRAPFSDPNVRQAIDLALDRGELVRKALDGFGTPSVELVPPAVLGYNTDLAPEPPDRARAKELLRKAGYPNGLHLRLDGPRDRYVNGLGVMTELARQLAEVGVSVDTRALPKEEFFSLVEQSRSPFFLYSWSCDTLHAGEVLDEVVRTPRSPGSLNVAGFSDPRIDELIDAADASPSLHERGILLSEALAFVAQKRAILPVLIQHESFGFSDRIEWHPSLEMALRVWEMKRTSVD